MPYPEREPTYGPRIEVQSDRLRGWSVAVRQTYGGRPSNTRIWSGMVTVFFDGHPVFDVEGAVIEGDKGRFMSWAQREYTKDGQKRYKSVFWSQDAALTATAVQAVEQSLGLSVEGAPWE